MLLLSQAIAQNAKPLTTTIQNYQQNLATVTSATVAVTGISQPVLNFPPPNWSDFTSTLTQAKINANQWSTIVSYLYSVPLSITETSNFITSLLTACSSYASSLQKNPGDQTTLQLLQADLNTLQTQLSVASSGINENQKNVNSFNNNLPALTNELQTLTQGFTTLENVDQAQVTKFQNDIIQLNNDISDQEQKIVDAGLAIGAALVIGYISGWTLAGIGVKIICAAVIAAASYGIDMASDAISADQANINQDTSQMGEYTSDVAQCVTIVQTLSKLVTQMSTITAILQELVSQWNTLLTEINTAVNDIKQAITDSQSDKYQNALIDITDASNQWNTIDQIATSMNVTSVFSFAPVTAGMTSDQIISAVNSAGSQNIVTYLSNPSASTNN
ncbi:MAG: hypothetical protein OHK0022_22050 [Roseiflexaceae bacterium]